jgi:hypothetical protein
MDLNQCPESQPVVIHIDVLCAWCLAEQGLLTPERQHDGDSHGICLEHAMAEYERYKASKVEPQ